jgi:hypothetical protein
MTRIKLNIAALMTGMILVAVGLAALRNATDLWASLSFTLAVALMLSALVGSLVGRGRAAWAGAGIFGWAYMAAAFGPWPWLNHDDLRPPRLLTAYAVDRLEGKLGGFRPRSVVFVLPGGVVNPSPGSQLFPLPLQGAISSGRDLSLDRGSPVISPVMRINTSPGQQVAHSLWSILAAAAGALIGRAVAGRDDRERSPDEAR